MFSIARPTGLCMAVQGIHPTSHRHWTSEEIQDYIVTVHYSLPIALVKGSDHQHLVGTELGAELPNGVTAVQRQKAGRVVLATVQGPASSLCEGDSVPHPYHLAAICSVDGEDVLWTECNLFRLESVSRAIFHPT